jgi:hypothetical protein
MTANPNTRESKVWKREEGRRETGEPEQEIFSIGRWGYCFKNRVISGSVFFIG